MLDTLDVERVVTEAKSLSPEEVVNRAIELDILIQEHHFTDTDTRGAVDISARFHSQLSDVLETGQHYLSPMADEFVHYWPAFIVLAQRAVKNFDDQTDSMADLKFTLYDFIGAVLLKANYPAHIPSAFAC